MRHPIPFRIHYLSTLCLITLLCLTISPLWGQHTEHKGVADSLTIRLRLDTPQLPADDSSKLLQLLPQLDLPTAHKAYYLPLPPYPINLTSNAPRDLEEAFRISPLEEKGLGAMPIRIFGGGISQRRYTNEDLQAKLLGLGIEIAPQVRLETSLTLGHIRPLDNPNPRQMSEIYAGLALRPSDNIGLRLGTAWRNDGIYRTLNPHASAHFALNDRLSLMVMGGAALFHTPIEGGWRGTQLYAGARLQYQLNKTLYLYGYGHTAYTRHFPSMGNVPWASQWTPQIGGGVGLNIDDSGPIELGVVYRYNVMTRRMEPAAEVNLFGAFNLLVKAFKGIFGVD